MLRLQVDYIILASHDFFSSSGVPLVPIVAVANRRLLGEAILLLLVNVSSLVVYFVVHV